MIEFQVRISQGRTVGSISNLGDTKLLGHFFIMKKGTFSKDEKGTSLFIAKILGALAPSSHSSFVYCSSYQDGLGPGPPNDFQKL